tara:strand:+ start:1571 stop:2461 length:891 start_codon:yes stop_codon:yes gene_type:complete
MEKEFEKFINDLVSRISDYHRLLLRLEEERKKVNQNIISEDYENLKKQVKNSSETKASFFFDIDDIYQLSIENNYFYFDCPLQVYKNHFEDRFNEYCEINIDAGLLDFIKFEIEIFNNPEKNRILKEVPVHFMSADVYYNDLFSANFNNYEISFNKKINFLSEKAKQFGFKISIGEGSSFYNEYTELYVSEGSSLCLLSISEKEIQQENQQENQENKKQLTTNQIVLILQETGFFTHPKIEDASKVKQAELISLITGLNQKNIKTNIEKLDKSPSKNGDNYQKDIDKINKILDDLI